MTSIKIEGLGTLTTEHAASSYGQPVLVIDGQAYGPADEIAAAGQVAALGLMGPIAGAEVAKSANALGMRSDALVVKFVRAYERAQDAGVFGRR